MTQTFDEQPVQVLSGRGIRIEAAVKSFENPEQSTSTSNSTIKSSAPLCDSVTQTSWLPHGLIIA